MLMLRSLPRSVMAFTLPLSLFLQGCAKEAVNVDPHFVGFWAEEGGTHAGTCEPYVTIETSGHAKYWSTEHTQGCQRSWHSGTARIADDELRIGSKRMHIDQYPTAIPQRAINYPGGTNHLEGTTSMTMTLDDIVFYRIDGH